MSENSNKCIIAHFKNFVKKGIMNMDDPELIALHDLIEIALSACTDLDLLDLIYKLLCNM